jgi:hypothetical protein
MRRFVERDAQSHAYVPAGDLDLVNDESQQGLFLLEVEVVDDCEDPLSEVAHMVSELVVVREFASLLG